MKYASAAAFRQALEERLKNEAASTGLGVAKDIDLGRDDDEQAAIRDITAAQQLALDDYFTFAAARTDELEDTDEFSAVRFHVTAQLAGRTFEQFLVDIGFSDRISWTPDTIHTSQSLSFAGIRHAMESTFAERARQPLPPSLPPPPPAWTDPYKRLAANVEIESDLSAAHARAATFLNPVLARHAHGQRNTHRGEWA